MIVTAAGYLKEGSASVARDLLLLVDRPSVAKALAAAPAFTAWLCAAPEARLRIPTLTLSSRQCSSDSDEGTSGAWAMEIFPDALEPETHQRLEELACGGFSTLQAPAANTLYPLCSHARIVRAVRGRQHYFPRAHALGHSSAADDCAVQGAPCRANQTSLSPQSKALLPAWPP